MAFQEMQVDTQPFPVNTIELTCKKVLVRPEMADKGKGENIVIRDPRTSNISQEELWTRRLASVEALRADSIEEPSTTT